MEKTFDRLSALDSFFLDTEREDLPMHIGAVCLFDGPQDLDRPVTLKRLRMHVESRLAQIPRYRQRLARVPFEGHPVWVDAEDFRITDHVRAVSLPAPASPGHLEETVSWIFAQPLSRSRPLWEIWLLEGLADGGFALVCKTHHCLADGLGGAALLCAILGTVPTATREAPQPWQPRAAPSPAELVTDAVVTRMRTASAMATSAVRQLLASPRELADGAAEVVTALRHAAAAAWVPPVATAFDAPTGTGRRFLWWSIALDDVKRIGRRLGGTVNDVALALVSEAFAQTSACPATSRRLRVYCPVGATTAVISPRHLGNRVSGMFIDLPVAAPDLKTRWTRVVAAARDSRESGSVEGTFLLANLADVVGPSLLSRIESLTGAGKPFNLVVTNVPGPREPLYLFEQPMTAVCPLVPLFREQGLGIAIFSYAGTLTWGFHVDASCIDAARQLRSALAAAAIRYARLADETVTASRHAEDGERFRQEPSRRATVEPLPVAAAGGRRLARATG